MTTLAALTHVRVVVDRALIGDARTNTKIDEVEE